MANDSSAFGRVLGTTELLESIILHLPPIYILISKRTCREFDSTFKGSMKIQRAVYGAARPDETWALGMNEFAMRGNSIANFVCPPAVAEFSDFAMIRMHPVNGVVPNPVLSARLASFRAPKSDHTGGYCILNLTKVTATSSCNLIPLPSPPLREVKVKKAGPSDDDVKIIRPNGITIGDILTVTRCESGIKVDLGRIKLMEEDAMQFMRETGQYNDGLWREVLVSCKTAAADIIDMLDNGDLAMMSLVSSKMGMFRGESWWRRAKLM